MDGNGNANNKDNTNNSNNSNNRDGDDGLPSEAEQTFIEGCDEWSEIVCSIYYLFYAISTI